MCDAAKVTNDIMNKSFPCLFHNSRYCLLSDASTEEKSNALKEVFIRFIDDADLDEIGTQACLTVAIMLIERFLKSSVYIHSATQKR